MSRYCNSCHSFIPQCCSESAQSDGPQIDVVRERIDRAKDAEIARLKDELAAQYRKWMGDVVRYSFENASLKAQLARARDVLQEQYDTFCAECRGVLGNAEHLCKRCGHGPAKRMLASLDDAKPGERRTEQ